MGNYRYPGPICLTQRPVAIDDGTMMRAVSPLPGPIVEDPLSPEDKATMAKVARMRKLAKTLGYNKAVEALDHFLAGSGDFVEIPAEKVAQVRAESEAGHREKVLKAMLGHLGMRSKLALALVDAAGNARPQTQWPSRVVVTMDYTSGTERSGASDDNLAYYGSAIKSEVAFECVLMNSRCYQCSIQSWKAWVVDNYDWEGDKQFGGDMMRLLLPTQKEMNRLTKAGQGKSYQRSSKSWQMDTLVPPWTECFKDDSDVTTYANIRRLKNQWRTEQEASELKDGALSAPRPAEELLPK